VSRRRKPTRFPYSLILALLLLTLLPMRINREVVVSPAWSVDLAAWTAGSTPASSTDPSGLRPFRVGDRLGYYHPEGRVANLEPVLYGASLGRRRYINYSQVPANLVLKEPLGGFVGSLGTRRYPVLDEEGDRVFLVNTESTGLAEVGDDGQELWRVEYASLITTLAMGDTALLVGLANGALRLYDGGGELLYGSRTGGSRIGIVLGCAIGTDSVAMIFGLGPQRLILIERRDGTFTPTVDVELATDHRREVFIRFSRNGERLYFEDGAGLGILDLDRRRMESIPFAGLMRAFAESADGALAAAFQTGGNHDLVVLSSDGSLLYRETLEAKSVFLDWSERGLVVGYDDRLLGLEVAEK
jgi:hypothetical protein